MSCDQTAQEKQSHEFSFTCRYITSHLNLNHKRQPSTKAVVICTRQLFFTTAGARERVIISLGSWTGGFSYTLYSEPVETFNFCRPAAHAKDSAVTEQNSSTVNWRSHDEFTSQWLAHNPCHFELGVDSESLKTSFSWLEAPLVHQWPCHLKSLSNTQKSK